MRNLWIFVLWISIETEFSVDFFAAATPCNPLGRFLAKAQNDKFLAFVFKSNITLKDTAFCHTERSEVSINLKCKFAPLRYGFFAF